MNNGVWLAVCSSFVFSIVNVLVKAASLSISPAEIAFFRSAIGAVIVFALMRRSRVAFSTTGIPMLLLRGLFGALYLIAYFYTIAHLPLADASMLVHLSPVFVLILSSIFLGERISGRMLVYFAIIMLGALMLVNPFQFGSYTIDALVGVASALFAAGASVTIRYLSKRQQHHSYEIVFYFLAISTLISLPMMWTAFVLPSWQELLYLALIAVISVAGLLFLTKAFTHDNAIVVEVTRYIGIAFNALWGFALWGEVPAALSLCGGALIIAACILMTRTGSRQQPPLTRTQGQQLSTK